MKKNCTIILQLLCLVMMSCTSSTSIIKIEKSKPENLKASVSVIASDTTPRNYLNVKRLNEVATYIKNSIEKNGLECRLQEFSTLTGLYSNVVCSINANSKGTIVIGAHYDSFGQTPGADDNASGVAGVIELSRILSINKGKLKYNVDIVAFTLEEPPFFRSDEMGSYIYASSIDVKKSKVVASIILEMIGFYSDRNIQDYPLSIMHPFYPDHGNFIAAVSNFSSSHIAKAYCNAMERINRLECQRLIGPSSVPGIDFSDHRNFWKFGIDAIMITDTAFNRNKNYHTLFDTAETLDYEKMADVIDGVAQMIIHGDF